jgi:hypothetical protein
MNSYRKVLYPEAYFSCEVVTYQTTWRLEATVTDKTNYSL